MVFDVTYEDFEYNGYSEKYYDYEVPFEILVESIRRYFSNQLINLDGKDSDIWNAFVDLDCLDDIIDTMEDWIKERCKDDAYEAFKEYVEEWVEDDE